MNTLNKGQGWLDSDLTEEGISQLHAIFSAINLPQFDRAYSSDLGRSIRTLEIMKPYIQLKDPESISYMSELRERFLGSFEGDYLDDMKLSISQKRGYSDYESYQKENSFEDYIDDCRELDPYSYAESFSMLESRVKAGIERIIHEGNENNSDNILVVGHRNSIRLIQHILLEETQSFERTALGNGEIIILSNDSSRWKQLNEF